MKHVILGMIFLLGGSAHALDTEQAYRMIPHQRTVFELDKSKLPASEAKQVARLLTLAEKAMVERVDALHNGARNTGYVSRIDGILWQIEQLPVTGEVAVARDHIYTAVQQQRGFFELQGVSGSDAKASRDKLVYSSHNHLIRAYNLLMRAFPNETEQNRQAFFDYLCALDFI